MDGNFSLSISEGSKLSITYIGYLDKDVAVSKGKTTLNIQLKEDTQALDEVLNDAISAVRCNAALDSSWKKRIDKDYQKRGQHSRVD